MAKFWSFENRVIAGAVTLGIAGTICAPQAVGTTTASATGSSRTAANIKAAACHATGSQANHRKAALLQRQLRAAVQATATRPTTVGFQVRVGDSISCGYHAGWQTESASTIKVALASALLFMIQRQHRHPNASETELIRRSITKSENDPTTEIWIRIGQRHGLSQFLTAAGVTGINPNFVYWGNALVSAAGQVQLLRQLRNPRILQPSNRRMLLTYMRSVVSEQHWGVSAGAVGSVALKNGWGTRSFGEWRVNSIGYLVNPRNAYDMAILSMNSQTMESGISTIEEFTSRINFVLH